MLLINCQQLLVFENFFWLQLLSTTSIRELNKWHEFLNENQEKEWFISYSFSFENKKYLT